jgi:hypothetical protein
VLLVSLGMAPPPTPTPSSPLPFVAAKRSELLLFVEARTGDAALAGPTARRTHSDRVTASRTRDPVVSTAANNSAPRLLPESAPEVRSDAPRSVPSAVRTAARVPSRSASYRYRPPATALRPRYRR